MARGVVRDDDTGVPRGRLPHGVGEISVQGDGRASLCPQTSISVSLTHVRKAPADVCRFETGVDAYEHVWKWIEPELGHLYIEGVDTSALDAFKRALPKRLGPKTVNQHLILIRAVLRFLWKRSLLKGVPYVPMEPVETKHVDW